MEKPKQKIVMCAEDDPDDFELFCETASKIDPSVQVVHAENGEILLRKLGKLMSEGKKPCLIVMDMNMPIMSGRETLIRLQGNEEWRSIPVAIYSTSSRNLYLDLEQNYGAKIFTKPASYAAIIDTVKILLSLCK